MVSSATILQILWIPIAIVLSEAVASMAAQSFGLQRGTDGSVESQSCPSADASLYYRPVIGIVTHPVDFASGRLRNESDASNIPASYVKFVESGGAQVIPLIYNEPTEILLEKLNLVNGVLFTGGWAKYGLYFKTIQRIFQITLDRNDAGDHFPLFATCLGFELISMIISKDHNITERFAGENQASTLQFTNIAEIQGTVFQRFFPELLKKMSTECLAMQNHKFGLSPKRLQENDALSDFFKILTTSTDKNNEVYISTVQAYKYPVTCFQWHPEEYLVGLLEGFHHRRPLVELHHVFTNQRKGIWAKVTTPTAGGVGLPHGIKVGWTALATRELFLPRKNVYEWELPMIPHTEDAVQVTQLIANYFISEARRSSNRPSAQKVRENVIYNYAPTFGGKAGKGYDEVYIFSSSSKQYLSRL